MTNYIHFHLITNLIILWKTRTLIVTYTTEETHKIIRDNLGKSMYGGFYEKLGTGPRYCPSIEDKVVRFADKERHQLFLEPESKYYDDIYLQVFNKYAI